MAKSSQKKKAAKKDNSNLLMALKLTGTLMIAMGVLALLAVVSGVETPWLLSVKTFMQGLGGCLCIGVCVLIIWLGIRLIKGKKKALDTQEQKEDEERKTEQSAETAPKAAE